MRYQHLFGPVHSRRLGTSLGIDVVPYKYCPLNCVYCEVQHTTHLVVDREEFFPLDEILAELKDFMDTRPELDYITFSGAGEPTLYSKLGMLISRIKHDYPKYKLALLTNGVLLSDAALRAEIIPCDLILPSLDSATQSGYERINKPLAGLKASDLIQGLIELRKDYQGAIWLEIFMIPGINDNEAELEALADAIARIKPDLVQLNSLDRPGSEDWVKPLGIKALMQAKKYLEARLTMPVEIIAKVKHGEDSPDEELEALVHTALSTRPHLAEELSEELQVHINEISKILRQLNREHKIAIKRENKKLYYSWKQ
ncbi:MAG: radical SAM protein [Candidatus Cloacimonetes bacterium]|nr:radical SAM protein [Candidatus Cloacimonadota bacterium]